MRWVCHIILHPPPLPLVATKKQRHKGSGADQITLTGPGVTAYAAANPRRN